MIANEPRQDLNQQSLPTSTYLWHICINTQYMKAFIFLTTNKYVYHSLNKIKPLIILGTESKLW